MFGCRRFVSATLSESEEVIELPCLSSLDASHSKKRRELIALGKEVCMIYEQPHVTKLRKVSLPAVVEDKTCF